MANFGGYSFTQITGTNSINVTPGPTIFRSVFIPGTYVGTVTFYDEATGTGTINPIVTLGLPATGIPNELDFNIACKNGLTYIATGTPVITFTWGN